MEEEFCIAAFRSRQQVMLFERELKKSGVPASIITTPRAVAMGCGLSVRFESADLPRAHQAYRQSQPGNLIGFYRVTREGGNTAVRAVGGQGRYLG